MILVDCSRIALEELYCKWESKLLRLRHKTSDLLGKWDGYRRRVAQVRVYMPFFCEGVRVTLSEKRLALVPAAIIWWVCLVASRRI
jgi:hypothetical protein